MVGKQCFRQSIGEPGDKVTAYGFDLRIILAQTTECRNQLNQHCFACFMGSGKSKIQITNRPLKVIDQESVNSTAVRDHQALITLNKIPQITEGGRFAVDGICLLYTSDAADDLLCVDIGDRRIVDI